MTALSGLWDGEEHFLEIDEHFPEDGAPMIVVGYEMVDEDEELDPFESPTRRAVLRDTVTRKPDPRFPLAAAEQAWGALSVALSAFARIAEVAKKQYQLVWPAPKSAQGEVKWSFRAEEHISERM